MPTWLAIGRSIPIVGFPLRAWALWTSAIQSARSVGLSTAFRKGESVVVTGNHAYVAASGDGLLILPFACRHCTSSPSRRSPRLAAASRISAAWLARTFGIQRSRDLQTWEDWTVVHATGDPQEVTDPTAVSQSLQFYRAVEPQPALARRQPAGASRGRRRSAAGRHRLVDLRQRRNRRRAVPGPGRRGARPGVRGRPADRHRGHRAPDGQRLPGSRGRRPDGDAVRPAALP